MRRHLYTAVLTAALLGAPAHAAPPLKASCGYDSWALPNSNHYTGVAYGSIVAADPADAVSIRCFVTVDGVERATTPTATGTGTAVTAGPVEFDATPLQYVTECWEYTVGSAAPVTVCADVAPIGFPPQEICDLVRDVTFGLVDLHCPWS